MVNLLDLHDTSAYELGRHRFDYVSLCMRGPANIPRLLGFQLFDNLQTKSTNGDYEL